MSELKSGELKFGDTTFRVFTRDDMARLALWSLRYALDGDRDGAAVRRMLLNLAKTQMLQKQDIAMLVEDTKTALAIHPAHWRQGLQRTWEQFVAELEELL